MSASRIGPGSYMMQHMQDTSCPADLPVWSHAEVKQEGQQNVESSCMLCRKSKWAGIGWMLPSCCRGTMSL